MKVLGLSLATLFLGLGPVYACPDLSGEYAFDSRLDGKIVVEQSGCESMTITHLGEVDDCTNGPGCVSDTWEFTQKLRMDGQRYEGINDSVKLAASDVYNYNITQFVGNRLVLRRYYGLLANCDGRYSFSEFDCQMVESSYGYDESLKTFTKTQVGSWRDSDGRYENAVVKMKKIR